MKKIAVFCLALALFCLCGCSTQYENANYHFVVDLPETMHVFTLGETPENDPALKQYQVDHAMLTDFANGGGVFFGVSQEENLRKEILISVQESDYTNELWELKSTDTEQIALFQDDLIESFQLDGYLVRQKGDFEQGRAHCIFLNISTNRSKPFDAVYMATIFNGKQYSILYQCSEPLTQKEIDQSQEIFDTFYINKTLQNPSVETTDNTTAKAVLVVILILIVLAAVVMVLRLFVHKKRMEEAEKDPYIPQFANAFTTPKNKEKKK